MSKTARTSIGFQPATYAALEDLADASGQSIASLVSSFMDEAAPSFASIAAALRLAKAKPIAALDLLQENLANAQANAAQGQLQLVESRKRHNKRRAKK
jgi:predicted DNA-binding ribbon-helix-helix protein